MDRPRRKKSKLPRLVGYGVAGVALVLGVTLGLRRLNAAVPAVDRATVWTDTVQRGTMIRQVQGQGTLIPEEIRWISAGTSARVERILALPGATVQDDTVVVELSNPDVELAALEAERQVASGEAGLTTLNAQLDGQRLAQESVIASLRSNLEEATRRARADQHLADKGYLSALELDQSRSRAVELDGRLKFERQRLETIARGNSAQLASQRTELKRLRSIADFRSRQLDSLKVRAGVSGTLQELPLQVGQAVVAGAVLAKVAKPGKLKAELRIPETQAKDVQIGQKATIDTHNGVVAGEIARIDPGAVAGAVRVEVQITAELPKGARPALSIDGTIELERLNNVLYVGRPAFGEAQSTTLFRLTDGNEATRAPVRLGRSSVKTVEIVSGLTEGDTVILSDMSHWDNVDRVRLR